MKRPSLASSMKALKEDVAPDPVAKVYHAATREGMKRLLVPVTPELHKRLKRLAVDQDTTLEALTRAAVEAYLDQHEGR
jgi:hypothetical protein